MPANRTHDWTTGPAKWFAVGVLGVLSAGALGWSALRSADHARATVDPVSARLEVRRANPLLEASPKRGHPPTPAASVSVMRKINLNTAPQVELELLPGIGPALAQRIIAHRTEHGPFKSIDSLDEVSGVGPKILARVRDRVTIGTDAEAGVSGSERRGADAPVAAPSAPAQGD